jgi:hypothetical protein
MGEPRFEKFFETLEDLPLLAPAEKENLLFVKAKGIQ